MTTPIPAFVEQRRSIRAFTGDPVERALLDTLVEAACVAPAPHHSRPWRFVVIDTDAGKTALALGMGRRWRADLMADGVAPERVDELVQASHTKLTTAPALVLACLTWDGLDRYPDEPRQRAEWGMALLSLGAAVENLMLSADARRARVVLGRGADLLPRGGTRRARAPPDWLPHALVLVGYPSPSYVARERPPVPLEALRANR